jgi:hypothetical protein
MACSGSPRRRFRSYQQIVAAVQETREGMAGVHGQRRQHWENFLLEVAICPGTAFCRQVRNLAHIDPVLPQLGEQLVIPKRILRPHKLAHRLLNAVEQLRGTQAIRANIARLTCDLLFDSGDANLEKLIQI